MRVKRVIFFIKLFLFLFIIIFLISFISGYFSSRVKLYIKQKATIFSSQIIASTISADVLPEIDLNNLVKTVYTDNENIDSLYINTYQINDILAKTTNAIANKLKTLDDEELNKLILPLGIVLSEVLFYDLGPSIKIKIYPVGAVKCDVKSVIEEYGINNSLFRLEIEVNVSFAVVVPMQKEEVEVTTAIPILVQIIQGEVPRYYFNSPSGKIIPVPID